MPAIWTEAVISTLNDMYIESSNLPEVPIAGPAGPVDGVAYPVTAVPIAPMEVPVGMPVLGAPVVLPPTFEGSLQP